jgi:VWFA-related protein
MRALLSTCVLVAAVTAVGAQAPVSNQPPQQPTFRGGINYIKVDMYASTRNGVPITDLRREEIELLEDGKAQDIKDFEHVQVDNLTPQELRIEPNSVEQSRQMAADGRARIFVIFLDTLHTNIEGSANMRIPLVRFLDRAMGSTDMVAVMTPEMSASDITFGRKTTVISNIMQREWTWGRRNRIIPLDAKEDLYTACYRGDEQLLKAMKDRWREKQTLDALADLIVHLQGIREERKAILTVSEGWRLFQPDPKLADRGGSEIPNVERLFNPVDRARNAAGSSIDKAQCDADRIALAQIDDARRMLEISESANRGNVTFYPIYPRGLAVFDSDIGPDPPPSLQEDGAILRNRHNSLRGLAIDTDGIAVINTNDIEGGISRIVADLSSYYLLGYESTNSKLDGKFRSITVRVKRPDTKVRARRGYRALTAEEVMTRSDRDNPGRATANVPPAVVVNPRAPFRLRATTWTSDAAGSLSASLWLVGELDFATRKELAWSNGANAEISVVSAKGDRVASLEVPFATSDGGFTVKVPTEAPLTPGDYAVRVRVLPRAGQALPLADLTRVVIPASAVPLGESVMLRRGPSTGPRYVATADPRFQKSDRLRLEIPTTLEEAATARLLDRTGKPLQVLVTTAERRDEAGGFRWVVADATLAPLAPGEYSVEVSVGAAKQLTPFRMVP